MPKNATTADLLEMIRFWYDGYSWDGSTRIFNPFSLLNFFYYKKFKTYWMDQDPSAKLLTSLMAKNPLDFTEVMLKDLPEEKIGQAVVGDLPPLAALFQTGYLTVDKVTYAADLSPFYNLRVPNREIRPYFEKKLRDNLNAMLTIDPETSKEKFHELVRQADENSPGEITRLLNSFFASLPAIHHRPEESFYHSMLLAYFHGVPDIVITLAEHPGAIGTPDLVVVYKDGTYVIIELKYKKETESVQESQEPTAEKSSGNPVPTKSDVTMILTKLAAEALSAVNSKCYDWPYMDKAKRIVKIGLGVHGRGRSLALMEF
jgi:hypothetical protein